MVRSRKESKNKMKEQSKTWKHSWCGLEIRALKICLHCFRCWKYWELYNSISLNLATNFSLIWPQLWALFSNFVRRTELYLYSFEVRVTLPKKNKITNKKEKRKKLFQKFVRTDGFSTRMSRSNEYDVLIILAFFEKILLFKDVFDGEKFN